MKLNMVKPEKSGHLQSHISNTGILRSKPMVGSKVDSAFHFSKVNKVSTRNFQGLSGKK